MSIPFARERLLAELAVQRASIVTKKVLSAVNKGELSKTDSTPVTVADFAAQALIISAIHGAFPSDSFIGEENADELRQNPSLQQRVWELVSSTHLGDAESEAMLTSPESLQEMFEVIDLGGRGVGGGEGRVWVLDPVDGTEAFLRGEQYAVALALVVDGEEKVGVLGCPNLSLVTGRVNEKSVDKEGLGLMLSAVRGEGTVLRPIGTEALQPARKIEGSKGDPMELKNVHFVGSLRGRNWQQDKMCEFAGKLGASWPGTDLWSSQMRYVALTVGGGDVLLRIPVKREMYHNVYDHAGGGLIFVEAGGKITDLEGKGIDFGAGRKLNKNWGMVAANKGIHGRILEEVGRFLKEDQKKDGGTDS